MGAAKEARPKSSARTGGAREECSSPGRSPKAGSAASRGETVWEPSEAPASLLPLAFLAAVLLWLLAVHDGPAPWAAALAVVLLQLYSVVR